VLFLDEPTIGLDVVAKENIRGFLRGIQEREGVTVILTTHDLGDIEQLCRRVIIIDQGKVHFDGELAELRRRVGQSVRLTVELREPAAAADLAAATAGLPVTWETDGGLRHVARFNRVEVRAAEVIRLVVNDRPVQDPAPGRTADRGRRARDLPPGRCRERGMNGVLQDAGAARLQPWRRSPAGSVGLYGYFVRLAFLKFLAYRLRYYTGVVSYTIFVAGHYYLYLALYAGRAAEGLPASIGGLDVREMVTYVAISWIGRSLYFNNISRDLARMVTEGEIAMHLIKPFHLQSVMMFEAVGEAGFRLIMFTIPIMLVVVPLFGRGGAGKRCRARLDVRELRALPRDLQSAGIPGRLSGLRHEKHPGRPAGRRWSAWIS
jgi:hypothetical protein